MGTGLFVWTHAPPEVLPKDAVIVVLGAGVRPDGSANRASLQRVEAGARLVLSGQGARMVITGGGDPFAVAVPMAAAARAMGVDPAAITVETASRSTLQNALFTHDLVGDVPAILVTQRFHLPRSWASYRWAGFTDLTLYASDPAPERLSRGVARQLLLEGVKWPVNVARAGAASAAQALGVPEARYIRLLD